MEKQIRYVRIIIVVFLGIMLSGCAEDDVIGDKMTPIKLGFDGLIVKSSKDKIYLTAKICSEGLNFKTYQRDKLGDMGYLSFISVKNSDGELLDEVDFKPENYIYFRAQMSYDSDYISMHYLTEEPPYEIAYEIKENLSAKPRIITMEYGDINAFRYTQLTITQAGR